MTTQLHQRLYRPRDTRIRWVATEEGEVLREPLFASDEDDADRADAHLTYQEAHWLAGILETGLAIDPEEIDTILDRHFRNSEPSYNPSSDFYDLAAWERRGRRDRDDQFYVIGNIYAEIEQTPLYRERYFTLDAPVYGDKRWFIPATLTQRGEEAAWASLRDLLYDRRRQEIDYRESIARWAQMLDHVSFPGTDTFRTIEGLRHRTYDALRARIPDIRRHLWTRHFKTLRYPTNAEWALIAPDAEVPSEIVDLQAQYHALHIDAWKRALPTLDNRDHFLFRDAAKLDPAIYGEVCALYHQKRCDLFIAQIQACTTPHARLWDEVASLDDTYAMVKAEAFLRKMQVWTPIDANGRRR